VAALTLLGATVLARPATAAHRAGRRERASADVRCGLP
jgi:hypothetical protein